MAQTVTKKYARVIINQQYDVALNTFLDVVNNTIKVIKYSVAKYFSI